jgi:hypothetical protein
MHNQVHNQVPGDQHGPASQSVWRIGSGTQVRLDNAVKIVLFPSAISDRFRADRTDKFARQYTAAKGE